MRAVIILALLAIVHTIKAATDADVASNPYIQYMNASLLTIYIRKKHLIDREVLEFADEIEQLFSFEEFDYAGIKEVADQSDVL